MKNLRLDQLPECLHISDIAAYTGLSSQTIRNRCNSGEIPNFKIGKCILIQKEDFIEFIKHGGGRDKRELIKHGGGRDKRELIRTKEESNEH